MCFLKKILKRSFLVLFLLSVLIFKPNVSSSAEILQINSSSNIEIGDQNRNLSINLFCIDVDYKDEIAAIALLKKNFPRGTKVKLKFFGKNNDNFLAKVYSLNNEREMTNLLFSNNLSSKSCEN